MAYISRWQYGFLNMSFCEKSCKSSLSALTEFYATYASHRGQKDSSKAHHYLGSFGLFDLEFVLLVIIATDVCTIGYIYSEPNLCSS